MVYVYQKEEVLLVQIREGSKNLGNSIIISFSDYLNGAENLMNASISVSDDEIFVESNLFPVFLNKESQP